MRSDKYRAWDIESSCMLSWEDIWNEAESVTPEEGLSLLSHIFRQDHYMLMRYTDFKDKNGVEIYYDDIYFCDILNTQRVVNEITVAHWIIDIDKMNDPSPYIEIIGNTHEHEGLLNANK